MKSKTSFFEPGVCRSLLRRSWPLWAGYAMLLLFLLPVSLARMPVWYENAKTSYLDHMTLSGTNALVLISFGMGILTAMVMFSYLYDSRSCGVMSSLPTRRESMFLTVWLTGIVPMLLADLLAALVSAALYLGRGLSLLALLKWLTVAVGTNLAFYGGAVFCAMLTGSLLILPVVYVLLNLAAIVAESCLRQILDVLVYGLDSQRGLSLLWLSPAAKLLNSLNVGTQDGIVWELYGLEWIVIYALAGLILSALALLLYQKRRMEAASDTVAIPVLKPLFRYCMSLGTALVFAAVVYSILLGGSFHGRTAAWLILALLLLGAALGWFAAEMLIRRTVRVFPGKWKGLLAVCAALALFVCAAEYDLTGFESRIPAPEELQSVTVRTGGDHTLTQADSIEKAVALHRSLVEHKTEHEPDIHYYGDRLDLEYELKDGTIMRRSYYLAGWDSGEGKDPGDLLLWEDLLNCDELRRSLNEPAIPVTEETIYHAYFYCERCDEFGREEYETLTLTPEQALDFYQTCVLPDLERGSLGRRWLVKDERYLTTVSNVSFDMDLRRVTADPLGGEPREEWDNLSLEICLDSENCLRWLREHTELSVLPIGEVRTADEAPAAAVVDRKAG